MAYNKRARMSAMNITRKILILAAPLLITACGDFEWFPSVNDSTAPTVAATIENKSIFNNRTTHISALNQSVVFTANEPTTIYYTTNSTEPTTASAAVNITSSSGVNGPAITLADTILWFFGIDKSNNASAKIRATIKFP